MIFRLTEVQSFTAINLSNPVCDGNVTIFIKKKSVLCSLHFISGLQSAFFSPTAPESNDYLSRVTTQVSKRMIGRDQAANSHVVLLVALACLSMPGMLVAGIQCFELVRDAGYPEIIHKLTSFRTI